MLNCILYKLFRFFLLCTLFIKPLGNQNCEEKIYYLWRHHLFILKKCPKSRFIESCKMGTSYIKKVKIVLATLPHVLSGSELTSVKIMLQICKISTLMPKIMTSQHKNVLKMLILGNCNNILTDVSSELDKTCWRVAKTVITFFWESVPILQDPINLYFEVFWGKISDDVMNDEVKNSDFNYSKFLGKSRAHVK